MQPEETNKKTKSYPSLYNLQKIILIGLVFVFLYSFKAKTFQEGIAIAFTGLMVSAASLLVGGLTGFIFGIPRTLQQDIGPESTVSGGDKKDQTNPQNFSYRANTNLELISDWLTKILVGVGLTQLTAIPGGLKKAAIFVSDGIKSSHSFALAIILGFLICGFFYGFLWARLHLVGAFVKADIAALRTHTEDYLEAGKQYDHKLEMMKQAETDAVALYLTQRHLNPSPGEPDISIERLKKSIIAASRSARTQIFILAQKIRTQNWKEVQKKPIMERTIPVFEALVESDTQNIYHRNHAQLGYALKDQTEPDWKKAESELSKAIEIRDAVEDHGWLFYEFNRAICKIKMDEAFSRNEPSSQELRKEIIADLKTAANKPRLKEIIMTQKLLKVWLDINKIKDI